MKSSKFLWINFLLLQVFLLGGTNVYATGISSEVKSNKSASEFQIDQSRSNEDAYLIDEAFSLSEEVNSKDSCFFKFFGSSDRINEVYSEENEGLQLFKNSRFQSYLKKILYPFHGFW
ncbi:hypothetical protein [Christiangramia portivictoriae]|uniref:hypothetical protein n=1 Tax=Christiangramia portivictoriae TaxID=326069 RepID=UPI000426E206|nr:hypothetical protein [Christiangramia portivictoriae]